MVVRCEFLMSEKTKATTDPGILQKGRQMGKKCEKIQVPPLQMFLFLKKDYFFPFEDAIRDRGCLNDSDIHRPQPNVPLGRHASLQLEESRDPGSPFIDGNG